jgi:ADP-ribose pyrophosphatase YjhB (NUDIX family)
VRQGASIAVFADGKVALIRRGRMPFLGKWSLPGGRIEAGEDPEAAARRELGEETGLVAGALQAVGQYVTGGPDFEIELAVFTGPWAAGELRAGDDAAEAGWFTPAEATQLPATPGLIDIIARAAGLIAKP